SCTSPRAFNRSTYSRKLLMRCIRCVPLFLPRGRGAACGFADCKAATGKNSPLPPDPSPPRGEGRKTKRRSFLDEPRAGEGVSLEELQQHLRDLLAAALAGVGAV